MSNNVYIIKRSRFLTAVFNTYKDKSIDYLIALRDALTIVIARRNNSLGISLEDYQGFIVYHGDMKGNINYEI